MGLAYSLLTVTDRWRFRIRLSMESQHSTFFWQESAGRVDLSRLAVSQASRQTKRGRPLHSAPWPATPQSAPGSNTPTCSSESGCSLRQLQCYSTPSSDLSFRTASTFSSITAGRQTSPTPWKEERTYPLNQMGSCLACDKGLAGFNVPQRLTVATVWELPLGRGKGRIAVLGPCPRGVGRRCHRHILFGQSFHRQFSKQHGGSTDQFPGEQTVQWASRTAEYRPPHQRVVLDGHRLLCHATGRIPRKLRYVHHRRAGI
jgi:hypothetical protein